MLKDIFVTEDGIRRAATQSEIEGIISVEADVANFMLIRQAQLAAKESAKAKLSALGLTEEEINALTGGI